jgi:hypothetical protein
MTFAPGGPLRGRPLRYLLTILLVDARRPLTVAELIEQVERAGLEIAGRPSKVISDALRWERDKGRVIRVGEGRYARGVMPPRTERWIRQHVRQLVPDRG